MIVMQARGSSSTRAAVRADCWIFGAEEKSAECLVMN